MAKNIKTDKTGKLLRNEYVKGITINLVSALISTFFSTLVGFIITISTGNQIAGIFIGALFLIVCVVGWYVVARLIPAQSVRKIFKSKYSGTNFVITKNDSDYYRKIIDSFIKKIGDLRKIYPSDKINIGIICGPTVLNIIDRMRKSAHARKFLKSKNLVFIAMNKGAFTDRYEYTANYLVSEFKRHFNFNSFAYTHNSFDKNELKSRQDKINILLCSAGSESCRSRVSWLNEWLEKLRENPDKCDISFPDDYIGDFCLTPITSNGKAAYTKKLREEILENIDPHPSFEWLGDVNNMKTKDRMKIIFPIQKDEVTNKGDGFRVTDKEIVASAVLRSGCVDTCIMDEILADNLTKLFGWFLIRSISPGFDIDCYRHHWVNAYDLKKRKPVRLLAYDPKERLESRFKVEKGDTFAQGNDYRQLIISEYIKDEHPTYNSIEERGKCGYVISGQNLSVNVDKGVRKPGQWSLATANVARTYAEQIRGKGKKIRAWDLGCGTGIVGIVIAQHCPAESIEELWFSDNEESAVKCTKNNFNNCLGRDSGISAVFEKSDMFDIADERKKREGFDLIVMNPPFAPREIIGNYTNDSAEKNGTALIEKFCANVGTYLAPGGIAILTFAEYAHQKDWKQMLIDGVGEGFTGSVNRTERFILYPLCSDGKHSPPHETRYDLLKDICKCYLEKYTFGNDEFIGFGMTHLILEKKEKRHERP